MKALVLAGTLLLAQSSWAAFATVNGEQVTMQDVQKAIYDSLGKKSFSELQPNEQTKMINQAIQTKLIQQKALDEGIKKTARYKAALKEIENKLLVEVWMKEQFENIKVSHERIAQHYKKNQNNYNQDEQIKARHIVVKTQKEAQDIIKSLQETKGDIQKAFIKLAKEKSIGPSAPKGGDLGWFKKGVMLDAFWQEAKALHENEYSSKPIQTQFGFHVVFVDGKQKAYTIPLEQITQTIENKLKMESFQQEIQKRLKQLRDEAEIKFQ